VTIPRTIIAFLSVLCVRFAITVSPKPLSEHGKPKLRIGADGPRPLHNSLVNVVFRVVDVELSGRRDDPLIPNDLFHFQGFIVDHHDR